MKYIFHLIILKSLLILLFNTFKINAQSEADYEKYSKFNLEVYKENDEVNEYSINYNFTINKFEENDLLNNILVSVKQVRLCNENDIIEKNKKNIENILLWDTNEPVEFYRSIPYLNVVPRWYINQKIEGKSFCFIVEDVGWRKNAYGEICDDEEQHPCPNLIVIGTTQLTYRHKKKEVANLNKYINNYYIKNGANFASLLNKYSYKDYRIDNNWLAIPIIIDMRILKFNTTTFNICKSQGYDIHYPPPLSDYWGKDYKKTWTWDKIFEYIEMIYECTGESGFQIYNNDHEVLKFFTGFCQSLNIPFITEDDYLDIKKCGLRNKESISKLTKLKNSLEKHHFGNGGFVREGDKVSSIYSNGFIYDSLYHDSFPELKYAYFPGDSTFLGGSGIIITEKSKYHEESFDYIELLISDKYNYISDLNASVTPYINIHGERCMDKVKKTKKDYCNSLLSLKGTYPYYYFNNNKTSIIYLTHTNIDSDNGVLINEKSFTDLSNDNLQITNALFKCDNEADFDKKTITYYDDYEIILPISSDEKLLLKSMTDIFTYDNKEQTEEMICNILDEDLKMSKPIEFPFSNFFELTTLINEIPLIPMFQKLYYNNETFSDKEFEELINDSCDDVDESLMPICDNSENKKYNFGECVAQNRSMIIDYLNCKPGNETVNTVECFYLPFIHPKIVIITIVLLLSLICEFLFMLFVILNRKARCIQISSAKFLLALIISSIIINISTFFWMGELKPYKCIIKVWTMIIGVSGFISTYSIKSEYIISIYNNNKLKESNVNFKNYFIFIALPIAQIVLLTTWSFQNVGIEQQLIFLKDFGFYYKDMFHWE